MTEEIRINMHGPHVATCLCCAHFDMGYEADWSEVTPGRGYYCNCGKGHFYTEDIKDYHELILLGQGCKDFSARDATWLQRDIG